MGARPEGARHEATAGTGDKFTFWGKLRKTGTFTKLKIPLEKPAERPQSCNHHTIHSAYGLRTPPELGEEQTTLLSKKHNTPRPATANSSKIGPTSIDMLFNRTVSTDRPHSLFSPSLRSESRHNATGSMFDLRAFAQAFQRSGDRQYQDRKTATAAQGASLYPSPKLSELIDEEGGQRTQHSNRFPPTPYPGVGDFDDLRRDAPESPRTESTDSSPEPPSLHWTSSRGSQGSLPTLKSVASHPARKSMFVKDATETASARWRPSHNCAKSPEMVVVRSTAGRSIHIQYGLDVGPILQAGTADNQEDDFASEIQARIKEIMAK